MGIVGRNIIKGLVIGTEVVALIALSIAGYAYLDTATMTDDDKCRQRKEEELASYPTYSGKITEIRTTGIVFLIQSEMEGNELESDEYGYYTVESDVFGVDSMNNARIKIDDNWFRISSDTYPYNESIFEYTLSVGDGITVAYEPSADPNMDNYVMGIYPYIGTSNLPLTLAEYFLILPLPGILIVIATAIIFKAIELAGDKRKLKATCCYIVSFIMIALALSWGTYSYFASIPYLQQERIKTQPIHVHAPIIYLYPEEATEVNVQLDLDGELTTSYPEYPTDGWTVTASPDGTLTDANGRDYDYLYWQGDLNMNSDFSQGFCVKGEDSAEFLETALGELGLNNSESNMFIMYWLPHLQANEYNVISFQTENYEDVSGLKLYPEPDNVIRVNMAFYGSDVSVEIEPQDLSSMNDVSRDGFTVVEWGGKPVTEP